MWLHCYNSVIEFGLDVSAHLNGQTQVQGIVFRVRPPVAALDSPYTENAMSDCNMGKNRCPNEIRLSFRIDSWIQNRSKLFFFFT